MNANLPTLNGYSQEFVHMNWMSCLWQLEKLWNLKFGTVVHDPKHALRKELDVSLLQTSVTQNYKGNFNSGTVVSKLQTLKESYEPPQSSEFGKCEFNLYNMVLDQFSALANASFKDAKRCQTIVRRIEKKRDGLNEWFRYYILREDESDNDEGLFDDWNATAATAPKAVSPPAAPAALLHDSVLSLSLEKCDTKEIDDDEAQRGIKRKEFHTQMAKANLNVQQIKDSISEAERQIQAFKAELLATEQTLGQMTDEVKKSQEATVVYKAEHTVRTDVKDSVLSVIASDMPLEKKRKICSSMTEFMYMKIMSNSSSM
jgi:hypothetical protein